MTKNNLAKPPLRSLVQENAWFFYGCLLWILIGTVGLFTSTHGQWVLFFSDNRTSFWDFFFKYGTQLAEEWAFVLSIFIFLFIRYRTAITLPILAALVTLVSAVAKKIFHQPRPLAYFRELGEAEQLTFVEGVKVNQGYTSFPSGHTMAGFALFCFIALNVPYKKSVGLGLFCLAMIVGLSRIYLVQHFLRDIYLGSILGVALAIGAYYFQQILGKKAWLDKRLKI